MSAPTSRSIGVRMHGVRLNLHCDHRPQLDYTVELLGQHVCPPWERPDIEAHGSWRVPAAGHDPRAPAFDLSGLDAYGKRMHLGPDQLVWTDTHRNKDLQLRFRSKGPTPAFDAVYTYQPSSKKLAKHPDYEQKKYFDLVRYLVFFPIAWHLKRTRGWELIHASAVASEAGAILVAGPGGAGKTTTSIALVALAGMTLLTENLVFSDGRRVYPVCEPIRLTEESLALLGDSAASLRRYGSAGGLKHKSMFVPPLDPDAPGVRPAGLFLARFSDAGFVQPLGAPLARELLRATNTLTLELNDFYWYAAALDLLWPALGQAHADPLDRLTSSTPCFSLGIDRSSGVRPVVDRILACMGERLDPVLETRTP